jgi:hypothetical protein
MKAIVFLSNLGLSILRMIDPDEDINFVLFYFVIHLYNKHSFLVMPLASYLHAIIIMHDRFLVTLLGN